ncbi:MAG TPA: cupin domain-containing protein [Vicinamibacterales bacterium]
MESRRTFLELAAASLLPVRLETAAAAQSALGDQPLGVIARHALTGPLEGYEVVLSRSALRYFPGTSTPVHRHPGVVLAYVLEGRVRFAINNEAEQIVVAGSTFFEPLGAVHTTSGSASADEPTRILVFEVRPKEQA